MGRITTVLTSALIALVACSDPTGVTLSETNLWTRPSVGLPESTDSLTFTADGRYTMVRHFAAYAAGEGSLLRISVTLRDFGTYSITGEKVDLTLDNGSRDHLLYHGPDILVGPHAGRVLARQYLTWYRRP